MLGSELETLVGEFVPNWLTDVWSFRSVHYFP
jgi:hypothetical protein